MGRDKIDGRIGAGATRPERKQMDGSKTERLTRERHNTTYHGPPGITWYRISVDTQLRSICASNLSLVCSDSSASLSNSSRNS